MGAEDARPSIRTRSSAADRVAELSIRNATEADLDRLAMLWFEGWQDAHAGLLPDELRRARTLDDFRSRLAAGITAVRCAVLAGEVVALVIVKKDEVYQFYVAGAARGTNVAPAMMGDALATLRAGGAKTAWLACAIGNDRAARFYEKSGWRKTGVVTSHLSTPDGVFLLDVWRYEFDLSNDVASAPNAVRDRGA